MFIYNLKLDKKKLGKCSIIGMFIIVIIIFILCIFKVFNNDIYVKDSINSDQFAEISSQNYTNILQMVHNDLNTYINQKICFTGYVYRLFDFTDTQFVLARNMVISSDFQTLVVGFLCDYKDAQNFKDNTWVEITAEITKGNYHGEIPLLKVIKMKEVQKPQDEFVYPPDDDYLPTSSIL